MLAAAFFVFALLAVGAVVFVQRARAAELAKATEVLFETRIDPPFLRPVVTRVSDDQLRVEAPVVHAKLVAGILVLDVKSNSGSRAEGFEVAVTEFDVAWLNAQQYAFHPCQGHLLVGPQGEMTDRLLSRVMQEHQLNLPEQAGRYVQAFELEGVVTDPSEFMVHVKAMLPNGSPVSVSYDYSSASLSAQVPTAAFNQATNYQPLRVDVAQAA